MSLVKASTTFTTTGTAHPSSFEPTRCLHQQTPCSHDPAALSRERVQFVAVVPVEDALIAR